MGKKLRQQRRGKGSNTYRRPPSRLKLDVRFNKDTGSKVYGEVIEFVDDPVRTAPLMRIRYDDNSENMLIAPEGMKIGDRIQEGESAELSLGSVMYLKNIPEGSIIYNIEVTPGDGGKLARTAGSYATVKSHIGDQVTITLPSKRSVDIDGNCRAEIGAVAGGGYTTQPIMKAGKNHHIKHARNMMWPRIRGVKSNPVDHPFGGKQHHKGTSSMVSRNAPPGAKVGHLAARRVGRKKRG